MILNFSLLELCVDCLEERRKEEIQSRFHYVKAKIYVHRLDSFDSDSSAIQQCVLSVDNNDNYSNNAGSEEKVHALTYNANGLLRIINLLRAHKKN